MIFPDRFPENQKFDNSKEKEFYIRFKRELPSDWDMFYSLKFKMPGVAVREIDYVILSPFGVFLIELKNARFKFYDSTWLIYDSREKRWKPHKKSQYSGPVEQVLSGITNFIEFLKINHHETLPTTEESFAGLVFLNKNEAGQINKQIKGYENILFHKDLDRFKLDTLILEYSIKNDIPKVSDKDLKTIKEIILLNANYVPSYQTRREEQRKIIYALTAEQLLIIDQINKVERLSISGVPGSGKTLLALRALEILDSLKWKTLFLSPTLAMASQFKSHTEDLTNLTIETFQNFSNISSSNKFDFVVVEESQTFSLNKFKDIDRLLVGGLKEGKWLIFNDDSQTVSTEASEMWKSYNPEVNKLTINIRNPKEIYETACILGRKSYHPAITAIPDAINVKFLSYESKEDEIQKLYELVNYGVNELGLSPDEIVILSTTMFEDTEYPKLLKPKVNGSGQKFHIEVIEDGKLREGSIGFSRVSYFIGLETSFIILAGMNNINNNYINNQHYIALTRSNYAAAVLFDIKIQKGVENLFESVD